MLTTSIGGGVYSGIKKTRRSGFESYLSSFTFGTRTYRNRKWFPFFRVTHYTIDTNGVAKNDRTRIPALLADFSSHNIYIPCIPVNPHRLRIVGRTATLRPSMKSVAVGLPPYSAECVSALSAPESPVSAGLFSFMQHGLFVQRLLSKYHCYNQILYPSLKYSAY